MNKQTKTLLTVGAVAVVGYLLFMQSKKKSMAEFAGEAAPIEPVSPVPPKQRADLQVGRPQSPVISVNPPFQKARPAVAPRSPFQMGRPAGSSNIGTRQNFGGKFFSISEGFQG